MYLTKLIKSLIAADAYKECGPTRDAPGNPCTEAKSSRARMMSGRFDWVRPLELAEIVAALAIAFKYLAAMSVMTSKAECWAPTKPIDWQIWATATLSKPYENLDSDELGLDSAGSWRGRDFRMVAASEFRFEEEEINKP